MNTEEAFKLLSLRDDELRKIYLDLLEENVKLKQEKINLEELLGGCYEAKTTK